MFRFRGEYDQRVTKRGRTELKSDENPAKKSLERKWPINHSLGLLFHDYGVEFDPVGQCLFLTKTQWNPSFDIIDPDFHEGEVDDGDAHEVIVEDEVDGTERVEDGDDDAVDGGEDDDGIEDDDEIEGIDGIGVGDDIEGGDDVEVGGQNSNGSSEIEVYLF